VQKAQERHASGCGTLTETRVSPLLVRPLVLKGTFCAAGLDRFRVEYAGPESARVVYNGSVLNVSTDGGRRRRFSIGSAVAGKASPPEGVENLERDFTIAVAEAAPCAPAVPVSAGSRDAWTGGRGLGERFPPRRIEVEGRKSTAPTTSGSRSSTRSTSPSGLPP
jgi:hypothetical protein